MHARPWGWLICNPHNHGQLYSAAQVRCRTCSPVLLIPGTSLPPASGGEGRVGRRAFLPRPQYCKVEPGLPCSDPGAGSFAIPTPCRAHSPCSWLGVGSAFLLSHPQGQLFQDAQVKGKASSVQPTDMNMLLGGSPDQGHPGPRHGP